LNIIDLASIYPVKRLVYPILSVSCELLCINWNELLPTLYRKPIFRVKASESEIQPVTDICKSPVS